MAVTNYLSSTFYVGVKEGEYFADRRADYSRDVYHYLHTPAIEEAEVFCDNNKGFLTEHGYTLEAVTVDDRFSHKHFYPFWAAKNLSLAS